MSRVIIRTEQDALDYLTTRGCMPARTVRDGNLLRAVIPSPCRRCGGSGRGPWYQDGGLCYECGGRDTSRRIYQPTVIEYARTLRRKEAACARRVAKAEERQLQREQAQLDGQRRWCEANGYGLITFAEKNAIDAKKREAAAARSTYVGEVGKRLEIEVTIDAIFHFTTMWGPCRVWKLVDGDGNIIIYKGSGCLTAPVSFAPLERGAQIKLRGTVKKHDRFRDERQTVISRPKVIEVAS